ncbi:MAG: hypothetical protein COA62_14230 [Rhodobiaceae bacterium]|nr:MAG: hypothetical protein COA62_14230 [Rhodobiaceae bacterium]
MSADAFVGFPRPGIRFLKDLQKNNDREWFATHKKTYEQELKASAEAFLAELQEQLETMLRAPVKAKLFRIHRDVRFSKDKTPYNTHVRMALFGVPSPTGAGAGTGVQSGFYFSLDTVGITYGAGSMLLEKQPLAQYRAAVDDRGQGAKVARMLKTLEKQGFRISDSELKRVPRGFDPEGSHVDLLRRKSLAVWRDQKGHAGVTGPDAIADAMASFKVMKPLHVFLMGL